LKIRPRNWRDFQHYKNRNPPWIRLHRGLLDNRDFHCLPVASRALAPMLWLLASESVDGEIDASPQNLTFRLRLSEKDITNALNPLLEGKFFEVLQDASGVLAEGLRDADSEAEAEAEREGAKAPTLAKSARGRKPGRSSRVPEDFLPDLAFAVKEVPDLDVEREVQKFRDWEFRTPRSDWPATWRRWINTCRETGKYAKLNGKGGGHGLPTLNLG
jgi:hypothetical protein